MTYKVFIAGILLLSAQTLSASDAVSDAGSQTVRPSTGQSGDQPTQPKDTQTSGKTSESADAKPATEESEPDCE
jgi:deoxyribose-phosphate aldolase